MGAASEQEIQQVTDLAGAVQAAVETVIEGKADAIRLAIVALLAECHLLIEDVPGVGKTMLARSLARAAGCTSRRIQFTPDLLPADITGVSVYNQSSGEFEFKPGGIFANLVVGDEINRASPKTQSALLEAMGERRVSVDGTSYDLPRPFLVIATQNPIEMEGTYPLPEAQQDRFGLRIAMGYPSPDAELTMLDHHGVHDPLSPLQPVTDAAEVNQAIASTRQIYAHPSIKTYLLNVVTATRNLPTVRVGASPRASLQLLRLAKALAAVKGRDYVIPEDIQELAVPALAHRLTLAAGAEMAGTEPDTVIRSVIETIPEPGSAH